MLAIPALIARDKAINNLDNGDDKMIQISTNEINNNNNNPNDEIIDLLTVNIMLGPFYPIWVKRAVLTVW